MTFQGYLDNIGEKTGLAPRQLLALAAEKGFGAGTAHSDPSSTLWLDGRTSNPTPVAG